MTTTTIAIEIEEYDDGALQEEMQGEIQESHLTCRICEEKFTKPKALPCLHTYCEHCLRDYIISRGYDRKGHFPCPLCRVDIAIPLGGYRNFPNNHLIISLQDTLTVQTTQIARRRSALSPVTSTGNVPSPGPQSQVTPSAPPADSLHANRPKTTQAMPKSHASEGWHNLPSNAGAGTNMRPLQPLAASPSSHGRSSQRLANHVPPPARASMYNTSHSVSNGNSSHSTKSNKPVPTVKPAPPTATLGFGQNESNALDISEPVGLVVLNTGNIIIADQRQNRLMVFSPYGSIQKVFSAGDVNIYGLDKARLDSVLVAVSHHNEQGSALVHSYTVDGVKNGTYGNFFAHIKPHGVALMMDGKIIVTSLEPVCVYILDESGKLLQSFGRKGSADSALLSPLYVATNHRNHVIISDSSNNAIKVFDQFGKFRFKISKKLHHPKDLCVDKEGNIIVADYGNHEVKVFSQSGRYLHTVVPKKGVGKDAYKPLLVALTPSQDKLVVLMESPTSVQVKMHPYRATPKPSELCEIM